MNDSNSPDLVDRIMVAINDPDFDCNDEIESRAVLSNILDRDLIFDSMTDQELGRWLVRKADRYNIPGLQVTILHHVLQDLPMSIVVRCSAASDPGCAGTFDEAVALLRAKILTPEKKAEQLKEKAAQMLKEAKELLKTQEASR